MRRLIPIAVAVMTAWGALGAQAVPAADKLRIVASTTDLKALAEVVTGDLAEVDSMARANQNPHDLETRPSLMAKLRRADAMIVNGLELDSWADVVAQGAPQHRAAFERNRQQFLASLDEAMGRWNKTLAPYKGSPVVVNHAMWIYLLTRFGLVQVGTVEERPGIPATANHIVKLIGLMKEDRVKAIVAEPWSDLKLIQRIAQEAGAQTAILAATVGAVKGTDTFIEAVDFNVKTLAQVLK